MSNIQGALAGSIVDLSNTQVYIPELWQQEVRRFRDQKLEATMCTRRIPFEGSKGDTLRFPNISRAQAMLKQSQTPYYFQARTDTDFVMNITRHVYSAFSIDDLTKIQAGGYNLASYYQQEAGYAIARDMDLFVLGHRAVINAYPSQRIYSYNDGVNNLLGDGTINAHLTGTPAPLSAAAILLAIQKLQEADVDISRAKLLISPAQAQDILSITQLTSSDFVSGQPVQNGMVKSVYGVPVIVTTQIGANNINTLNVGGGQLAPTPGVVGSIYLPDQFSGQANIPTTADARDLIAAPNWYGLPVRSGAGATAVDGGQTLGVVGGVNQWATAILCSEDWLNVAVQKSIKTETGRLFEHGADGHVTSTVYGAKISRPDTAVLIHTSAI